MLPHVSDGVSYATVETAYNLAQSALSGYIAQVHSTWHASINAGVSKDLDCKLLVSSPSEGGLLTCNFNKTALAMFQEVRCNSILAGFERWLSQLCNLCLGRLRCPCVYFGRGQSASGAVTRG